MSNPVHQSSEAAAANIRYAAYEKRKVADAIAIRRDGMDPIQSTIAADAVSVQPVEHLVNMARRHGAHGFRGDPKKEIAADDGGDVLALAAGVGLKGFTGPATVPVSTKSNANDNRSPDNDDGSEVLALAAAVGLKGFAEPTSTDPGADKQPAAAPQLTKDGADDGSDVLALARSVGIKGFVK